MSNLSIGSDLICGALLAFGFSPGPPEMLLILVIALLLYGGKLPEMARTWGKTVAEFRRSLSGIQSEINDAMHTPDQLEYSPEKNSYDADSVNEYSEYDEPSPDEESDGESQDETATDDTPADSDTDEEHSSEKREANESD